MDVKKRGLLSVAYAGVGMVFAAAAKFDWLSKGAAASFLSLVWLGFVLAISCTESWVKFRAPFMPRHLALDLGRTMFAALNSVEIGLCAGLWLLHFLVSSDTGDAVWRLILATLLLAVQAAWLYPKLQLTAEFALYEALKEMDDDSMSFNQKMQFGEIRHQVQIQDRPRVIYHILYVGAEFVKILTLLSFALHFLKAIPAGDGTIRKNRNLWGRWAPGSALTLHPIQIDLGLRAAALLRDNGDSIMTYSTCSLNPVENEAVVAELLRRADGALELVDCSEMLPGLVTRPGVTSWSVAWQARTAKGEARAPLQWFDQYESVPDFLQGSRIPRSMFPPADEEIRKVLPRCLRLFPTDQNTGGFFVAVLRKVRNAGLPGRHQRGLSSYEVAATASGERKPSRKAQKLAEQGIVLHNDDEKQVKMVKQTYTKLRADRWEQIKEFYGIADSFPHANLYSRSEGTSSVCLVNPSIREAILAGEHPHILDTGLRVFARVQAAGKLWFRLTEEGLEQMLPFITKRKASATTEDLVAIVSAPGNDTKQVAFGIERCSELLQESAAAVRENSGVGPMLMVLPESARNLQLPTALPVWVGDKTLTLLVDKATRDRMAHASQQ
ncbi:hypothetical protein JG687_00000882 [Phytophthora cactorum]|uniref:SAM-dependent MTase RsmB/NOP-type domain-containing protein n=2 Tax=Phytophthora cactorum TaxID=29920 RepID=A0A8T1UZG1_9STRA|nr:hypothetical protein JG687_00000882 [Phytophthora cactorum]